MEEKILILKPGNKRRIREAFIVTGEHESGGCARCKLYPVRKELGRTCSICFMARELLGGFEDRFLVVPKRFWNGDHNS